MREMKDSGIEWIGIIPASWELYKGKYMFAQRNLRGNTIKLQLLSPTQKYGVIPQSVYEERSGMNAVKLNENANLSTLKTIHKGDFCISLRSFQGGFEYSEYEGVVSPAYQVFYPVTKIARGYYKYLFKECGFIEKMNSYTMTLRDGKNIAFADFGNTYIPFPPVDEQRRIADFLDTKCAEIDALTADIQTQIDTLEQYKRSVITETVTKGLNPDAEMKDSGIEWIGVIPNEWAIRKGKYMFTQRSLRGNSAELQLLSPAYQVFCPTVPIADGYYKYLFKESGFIEKMNSYTMTLRDGKNIAFSDFGNTYIPYPPVEIQSEIALHLDKRCSEINKVIMDKQAQLVTLDEYKKSLIFEYVTGKSEVPNEYHV